MSYMSLFEKSARNSVAISVLNKLRHWLQGRQPEGLSYEEKNVMEEALKILESPQFEQMVIRSFQGLGDNLDSSVLPIAIAITSSVKQMNDTKSVESLKNLIESNTLPEIQKDKDEIISFLNQAIQVIGNSNLQMGSSSFVNSYSKGL
jgi:hypothetical protein